VKSRYATRFRLFCARLVFAIFLGAIFVAGAPRLRAQSDDSQQSSQDVAGGARQERARKQNQETKHVYTNEDLRRGKFSRPQINPVQRPSVSSQLLPLQSPTLNLSTRTPTLRKNRLVMLLAVIATRAATPEKTSPFHLPSQQPELAGAENSRAPAKNLSLTPQRNPSPKIFALFKSFCAKHSWFLCSGTSSSFGYDAPC